MAEVTKYIVPGRLLLCILLREPRGDNLKAFGQWDAPAVGVVELHTVVAAIELSITMAYSWVVDRVNGVHGKSSSERKMGTQVQ